MIRASRRDLPTLAGLVSIIFWSTTVGFARRISEDFGGIRGAALIFLLAGVIGTTEMLVRPRRREALRKLPAKYLAICGSLFVTYSILLYLGIGFAADNRQAIGVGLLNYLWPALILLFSLRFQHNRPRPTFLVPGLLAGLVGGWVAVFAGNGLSLSAMFETVLVGSPLPYVCGLGAAVVWGLYSNLSRVFAAECDGDAVPLFLLATGVILGTIVFLAGSHGGDASPVSVRAASMVGYMAVVPSLLAYTLWDIAMRRGDLVLVAAISYATPLISTVFSSIVLTVSPGPGLWIAALLVTAGAVLCRFGVVDPSGHASSGCRCSDSSI